MSQSPSANNTSSSQRTKYLQGWKALNRLLHEDRSFSGREKHCAFLNANGETFADVSSAIGFDFYDDGRALALCDWDFDGRIDVWVTNRTAPRVRLLRNQSGSKNKFVALQLTGDGITANSDAIGARVALYLEGESIPLLRMVRAGDAFLSQSSSWLLFGIGDQTISKLVIDWPGAGSQEFSDVEPGTFYRLEQGGSLKDFSPPSLSKLTASKQVSREETQQARIVLAGRLPVPSLTWINAAGEEQTFQPSGKPALINLWTSSCLACVHELTNWTENESKLNATGLQLLSLNLDALSLDSTSSGATSSGAADGRWEKVLTEMAYPFTSGRATSELVTQLDLMQQTVLDRRQPMPVPTSFLLDKHGLVSVIYKGPVAADVLIRDMKLLTLNHADTRLAASPFDGRWAAFPPPSDPAAYASMLIDNNLLSLATSYLESYARTVEALPTTVMNPTSLNRTYYSLGLLLQSQQQWEDAIKAFETSLSHQPNDVRVMHEVAQLHLHAQDMTKAIEYFEKILKVDANDFDALRTLALIRTQQGKHATSVELFRRSVAVRPSHTAVRLALSEVLVKTNQHAEALEQLREILKRRPNWPPAANNLAWLLATHPNEQLRNGEEALKVAKAVVDITEKRVPAALDTLAAAYAETGRFDEAIKTIDQAIKICPENRPELLQELQQRRAAYSKNRPFRQDI